MTPGHSVRARMWRGVALGLTAAMLLAACSAQAHSDAQSIRRTTPKPTVPAVTTPTSVESTSVEIQAAATVAPTTTVERDELIADCAAKLSEFELRQAEDRFDWAVADEVWQMLLDDEAEREQVVVEVEPFDGSVRMGGGRPTFDDFAAELDVTALGDLDLLESVDVCNGLGVFDDQEA